MFQCALGAPPVTVNGTTAVSPAPSARLNAIVNRVLPFASAIELCSAARETARPGLSSSTIATASALPAGVTPPAIPVALGARASVPKAILTVRSLSSSFATALSTSTAVRPPWVNVTAECRPVAVRATPGPLSTGRNPMFQCL